LLVGEYCAHPVPNCARAMLAPEKISVDKRPNITDFRMAITLTKEMFERNVK